MCAPWVTRYKTIRYSSSCHTRVHMGASIFFIAAMIRAFRSARSRGNGGSNTQSLTYPQRRKSQGVMLGDLGGHSVSGWSFPDTHRIHCPGNTVQVLTNLAVEVGKTSVLLEYEKNLLGKIFLSCSFYLYRFCKYVSYGFPVIDFCIPGVHYEMHCVCVCVYIYICAVLCLYLLLFII
jgi:hypothetical protein